MSKTPQKENAPGTGSRIAIAAFILAATFLVLFLYWPGIRPPMPGTSPSTIGGPFTLVDPDGNTVTEDVLKGHFSLVFFGYTYCPDVCPLALQNIAAAMEMMGAGADDILPVFISVDPERDRPDVVGEYVAGFDPRFLGLTGTPEQVQAAEQSYHVYAAKGQEGMDATDYFVDHTGYIYLMDRSGRFITTFQQNATPVEIANKVRQATGAL